MESTIKPKGREKKLLRLYDEAVKATHANKSQVRRLVFQALIQSQTHLNAEQLMQYLNEQFNQKIGLATIYRSLNFLEQANLVVVLNLNQVKTYEAKPADHHDHLVCDDCGRIVEFLDEVIEHHQEKIAQKHHFTLTDHSLILNGLCKDCQKEK